MSDREIEKNSTVIEGRNAVLEAFRSGKTIDKLFVLEHCQDGPVQSILREAKKRLFGVPKILYKNTSHKWPYAFIT